MYSYNKDLQLIDYKDGYRFRIKCKSCGYGSYIVPEELLTMQGLHRTMYLDEVAEQLLCRQCKKAGAEITPIILARQHHFVGGMV
ncbi:hypothetical protein [Kordiimonas pumila]|uniref:YgiT-type zinc finger protein n=1 Tax=Kordiimonas pumila TaxID=2161677 RepID=A0ABV7D260_9PROT|nr:hypothetical protein [Kordiimonas pumila]